MSEDVSVTWGEPIVLSSEPALKAPPSVAVSPDGKAVTVLFDHFTFTRQGSGEPAAMAGNMVLVLTPQLADGVHWVGTHFGVRGFTSLSGGSFATLTIAAGGGTTTRTWSSLPGDTGDLVSLEETCFGPMGSRFVARVEGEPVAKEVPPLMIALQIIATTPFDGAHFGVGIDSVDFELWLERDRRAAPPEDGGSGV